MLEESEDEPPSVTEATSPPQATNNKRKARMADYGPCCASLPTSAARFAEMDAEVVCAVIILAVRNKAAHYIVITSSGERPSASMSATVACVSSGDQVVMQ